MNIKKRAWNTLAYFWILIVFCYGWSRLSFLIPWKWLEITSIIIGSIIGILNISIWFIANDTDLENETR
jgi:hypothetical protein